MHIAMIGTTAPSHIYPSLALVAELVNRGHRLTYAVGESLAHLVEPAGATVLSFASILPQEEQSWPDDPAEAMHVFLDEALASFEVLAEFFDADRPDLLLYDIGGLAAPVLGRRYGVDAVQLSPAMVAWEGYEDDLADVVTPLRESESGERYRAAYAEWLTDNGIEADPWQWISNPERVLSLIPRVMQPNADRVSDAVQFVGPCLDPARLADRSWTPPKSGAPVLYISFGTGYNDRPDFYRTCIEAFGDSPWHVVISVGDRVDRTLLGDVPNNIEIHTRVPQLAVLSTASAFVTHAGMGGCIEALWFGVPTVAIPQAVDQFGNADILEALGVGKQLKSADVTASSLRDKVDEVAGSVDIRARLADVSAEVRADGGVGSAADAVESSLRVR